MDVTLSGYETYLLVYYIILVTKYRRKILNPGVVEYLWRVLPKLARSMSGVVVEQMGFDRNHVHFVTVVSPKYVVANIMGKLKCRFASILREKFVFLKRFIGEKTLFGRQDTLLVA